MTECSLREVESAIRKMRPEEVYDDIAETEDIWLVISGWYVWIPEYALVLCKGIICVWDEESKMHIPDEAVTVIREIGEPDIIFYLRGSFAEALSVWTDGAVTESEAEELKCRIVHPVENGGNDNEVFNQGQ